MTTLNKRVMVRLSPEVYEELTKVANHNRRKPSTLARFLIESGLGFDDGHVVVIPADNDTRPANPS